MRRDPQKMWEKGLSLSEAILRFSNFPNAGDSLDKIHYLNLCEPAQEGECKPVNPDFYKYYPKEPWYRDRDQRKYKKRLCEYLCKQLFVGKLIAIGTQINPVKENLKKEIPNLEFQFLLHQNSEKLEEFENFSFGPKKPFTEWDDDAFQGETAHYEDVRIYDPRYNLDGTKTRSAFSEENQKIKAAIYDKPGRPSKRETILAVFEELKSKDKINFPGKQIAAVRLIQNYIKENMPDEWGKDGKGFSEKAIGNHIRELFNVEKNKLKNI